MAQVHYRANVDLPYKDAEGFGVRHVHQQRTNHEPQALAIANFRIVQTEALEHSSEHLLSLPIGIAEHLHIREATADVLPDQPFVWTRLAAKSLVLR